ncbi:MAG: hypothetical protein C0448_16010 [Sphingobacteriaceae bacterium]|nr:hypothetical protein [Sphingobacteriaceae bacterium]
MQTYGNLNKDLVRHRIAEIRNNNGIENQMTLEEQYNHGAHTLVMRNDDNFIMNRRVNAPNQITGFKKNTEEKEEGLHEHLAHSIGSFLGLDLLMMLEHGREASKDLNTGQTIKYNLDNIDPITGLPYNRNKQEIKNDFKLSDYRTRTKKVNEELRSKNQNRNTKRSDIKDKPKGL